MLAQSPPPFFSVITPSYNMLEFLPLCCASVADQNVDCEHIVVDAASTDGTVDWLKNKPGINSISEKDDGMYDALNKGIRLAHGEFIAHLNCDEQYLPGVLLRAAEIFQQDSKIDILFGNTLVVCPNGNLLSYRKGFVPRWAYIWASHMYVHTSSMFVRRRVFESGIMFDKRWKAISDMDFVVRVLRSGFTAQHVDEYFSAFIYTGSNLSNSENALVELKTYRSRSPWWLRHSNFITHNLIRLEKIFRGAYWEKMPLSYSIYTSANLEIRSKFIYTAASSLYPQER